MKKIKAAAVKKLPAGSSVWLSKKGTGRKSEFTVIQYGKEKRIRHTMAGESAAARPIKDYPGFIYETK